MKGNYMKKIWVLGALAAIILSFYVGMALETEHPMDRLYNNFIDRVNHVHVVNFKSGIEISEFAGANSEKPVDKVRMKREGIFDAWSKFINFRNVEQFTDLEGKNKEEVEEDTSLTRQEQGKIVLLPTSEVYFKNHILLAQDREAKEWSKTSREQLNIFEMLPFNSELLNRYAKHYKSENRGKFVVFFFSVDPNYLTRTFSDVLPSYGYNFKPKFTEGTIKMLVYPDTLVPRRIYSIYRITDTKTDKSYEFYFDTWYSPNEDYKGMKEPALPRDILDRAS